MSEKKTLVYHMFEPGFSVERGTGRNVHSGKPGPGFRWVRCYCQITPEGGQTIALTRREWRDTARIDKAKLRFHKTREAAVVAATGHTL